MKNIKFLFLAVIATLFYSCKSDNDTSSTFDQSQIFINIDENILSPSIDVFITECELLESRTDNLVNIPNQTNLQEVKESWCSLLSLWSELEVYNIYGIRLDYTHNRISKYPINTAFIESYIADTLSVFSGDFVAGIGSTSKGLHAIEYLLYGNLSSDSLLLETHRLNYLNALSEDLITEANYLKTLWEIESPTYRANTETGVSGSINTSVNAMISITEEMLYYKLGSVDEFTTTDLPAYRSEKSKSILLGNLVSLKFLFQGDTLDGFAKGIDDYADFLDAQYDGNLLSTEIKNQIETIELGIAALNGGLETSLINEQERREQLYDDIHQLLILIKIELASVLTITVTISDNDGD